MAKQFFDLNAETKKETLDLTLRLGVGNGERSTEGSHKRKRADFDENASTFQSSEERLTQLELQVKKLEELLHRYNTDLARKIDLHFSYAAQNLYTQQSAYNEGLKKIHNLLQEIIESLQFPPTSKVIPTPSTAKKPTKP